MRTVILDGSGVVDMVNAVLGWFYWKSPDEQVRAIFGSDHHPSYLEEKTRLAQRSPMAFWGSLDRQNQARLIALAITDWNGHEHEEETGEDQEGHTHNEEGHACGADCSRGLGESEGEEGEEGQPGDPEKGQET